MRTHQPSPAPVTPRPDQPALIPDSLSRRGFLRAAALTGGGLAAASIAACAPAAAPVWTFSPSRSGDPNAAAASPTAAAASPAMSHGPTHSGVPATPAASGSTDLPPGWSEHDIASRTVIRRYLGNLVPALGDIYPTAVAAKLADILGVEDDYPELRQKPSFAQVPNLVLTDALTPLEPEVDGDTKVFRVTVEEMDWRIDELAAPVKALGYNGQWPGPTIRVNQGDKVRAIFTNNLPETTSVHFHGVEFDDFFQDGVPFVTQKPIVPGEEYAYEFTAVNAGSHMYHSHHNATDQVGRGLLGAFIVEPSPPQTRYDREYIWISNDTLGGFTINGHGFPATVPVLAAQGERVLLRFHERGLDDASVAQPRFLDGARRPRRQSARERCPPSRHVRRQPRRAMGRSHHRRTARGVGVPLSHPLARRRHERDVRDGHRARRRTNRGRRGRHRADDRRVMDR